MRASKRTIVGVLALSAGTVCGIAIAGGSAFSATYGKGRAHAMRYEPPANIEAPVDPVESPPVEATDGPIVQLALLLDTSNSMDGLIDQAKARLWSIVNEMSKASHDGRPAQIRVALYEYGNDGVPSAVGHVRQRTPFTTDLDILSEQLFSLRTDGGSEYCGWVVGDAVTELDWLFQGDAPRDVRRSTLEGQTEAALDRAIDGRHAPGSHPAPVVRIIVIAGNEPFTQGTVPHTETIAQARARGITVNTIFCGPRAEGEATGWSRGAELGGGRYANIDPDTRDWAIPTPYDGDLEALNTKLNTTYLPYGEDGHRFAFRQGQADRQNRGIGALYERVKSKASKGYQNTSWDLVDAARRKDFDIAELDDAALPAKMRGKTIDAKLEIIRIAADERVRVTADIAEISVRRDEFIAEKAGKMRGLGAAIIGALRDQVRAAGLTFEAARPAPETGGSDSD